MLGDVLPIIEKQTGFCSGFRGARSQIMTEVQGIYVCLRFRVSKNEVPLVRVANYCGLCLCPPLMQTTRSGFGEVCRAAWSSPPIKQDKLVAVKLCPSKHIRIISHVSHSLNSLKGVI